MKVLRNIGGLKKAINNIPDLGFIPTMGGLHNGHISLIKESKKKCKKTIVSIYVNPKQFDNKKDFYLYPRTFKKDFILLKKLKIDFLFIPKTKEIYKTKFKKIKLANKYKCLCAKFRSGHFEGVLNIMERFIKLINPKYIFMGEKDYQQLFLIEKILNKNKNINIIKCKTVRNKDFLALSSRNNLLTKKELVKAAFIARNLYKFKNQILKKNDISKIILNKKKDLINRFNIKIEYLEAKNLSDLMTYKKNKKFKIFIAYYIRQIRLIDNF
ncbi:pantoate--beta-alanine ligase [Candidatus Pelagibacter sp.]|nr:pantoate--beta-alanine ligase [Candidatus Pelagibacter sp.]|tara:strand:- start:310 stop:1119 length:810 start_codon:yes stop_codon:yes gene_type:complete